MYQHVSEFGRLERENKYFLKGHKFTESFDGSGLSHGWVDADGHTDSQESRTNGRMYTDKQACSLVAVLEKPFPPHHYHPPPI